MTKGASRKVIRIARAIGMKTIRAKYRTAITTITVSNVVLPPVLIVRTSLATGF
jgi:hypothetical protein